jgi:hypothetical protein
VSADSVTQSADRPTPILDRLQPLPKSGKGWAGWFEPFSQILTGLAIFSLVGFFALFPGLKRMDNTASPKIGLIAGILFLLGAGFMALIIHELGHFFVGRWAGFRFRYIRFGSIQIDRSLKVSYIRNREASNLGVTCFFPAEMKNQPWKFVLMVIAGPAANIGSAAVFLLLFNQSFIWIAFAGISFCLGVINLVPSRSGYSSSDGLQILTVLFKRAKHERSLAFLQLVDEIRSGADVKSLPSELVYETTLVRDNSLVTVLAYSIAYARAYYGKDNPAAAFYLETCLKFSGQATTGIRSALIADAAIFQAERRGNVALAEQWLADLPNIVETKSYRLRAEGAIFEARGDFKAALEKIADCEKMAQAMANEKSKQRLLVRLSEWRKKVEEKLLKEQLISSGSAGL